MDVFTLAASIVLNTSDYEKGLEGASQKTSSFGDKLKSGLATAAKVSAVAIGAATTAVGALTKQSIDGYAEYEQLVGGVETLYGTEIRSIEEYAKSVGKSVDEVGHEYEELKNRQNEVMENASNAYKTAGLSANEYMETVNGFAASLTSSLGEYEWQAASYADMIVTDMADNANKMGTSMESIQNAYSGFAKQNYTMLDNLKLGYGGTKEEMERLLSDAEKYAGYIEGSLNIESFADVADAIHIVQEEMGITGTTAKEAATTIQGSVATAKSAWENLVAGIGNENADLSDLITRFVESVGTAAENVVPRVQQILVGMGEAVQKLAPVISEQIPALIEGVLPSLLEAGTSLVTGLLSGIIAALPALAEAAPGIIEQLSTAIIDNLPALVTAALMIVTTLASGISGSLPELIPAAVEAILQIVETLTDPSSLSGLVDAAVEIMVALATGLIEAIPKLIEAAPVIVFDLVTAIIENAPKLLDAAVQLMFSLANGIIGNIPSVVKAALEVVNGIKNTIMQLPKMAVQWGKDLITNFVNGIKNSIGAVKNAVSGVASTVKSFLGFSEPEEGPLSDFHTYAPDMMKLFAQGITDNAGLLRSAFDRSLDLGAAALDFSANYAGSGYSVAGNAGTALYNGQSAAASQPIIINLTARAVLNNRAIGEAAYQYIHDRDRAYGGR